MNKLGLVLAMALSTAPIGAQAVEKAARIVGLGTCWTGTWAAVATMDNGDKLYLGDIADQITKSRYASALAAKANGELVFYQIMSTNTVCSIPRGSVEWWVVGSSVY